MGGHTSLFILENIPLSRGSLKNEYPFRVEKTTAKEKKMSQIVVKPILGGFNQKYFFFEVLSRTRRVLNLYPSQLDFIATLM